MEEKDTEYTREYKEFCLEFWQCVKLSAVHFENVEKKTLESAAAGGCMIKTSHILVVNVCITAAGAVDINIQGGERA